MAGFYRGTERGTTSNWHRWAAALLLWLAFALMLGSALQKSPTVDEQSHLFRGVAYLQEGATHFLLGHPLGASALSALPVLTEPNLTLPLGTPAWEAGNWSVAGDLFMWRLGNNPQRLLFFGRLPMLWLSLLLFALAFRWARQLAGGWVGLLALALLALDPNLLAHGRIISGDVPPTIFFLLAVYGFWRWSVRGGWVSLLWSGVGLGLASVSKFNGALLLPILGLLGLYLLWQRRSWRPMGALLLVGAVGSLVIWGVNGFAIRPLPGGPFWEDLFWVLDYFGQPHGAYLAGDVSPDGWWYYFPLVFLLKTPLPTLGLLLVAVGLLLRNGWVAKQKSGTQRATEEPQRDTEKGRDWLFLLLPPLVYMGFSLTSSLNIGYRHLLPLLPFLWIFTAVSLQSLPKKWQQPGRWAAGMVVLWLGVQAVTIWPNYIPFFNLLAGGPDESWRLLSDSNVDWGQDLPALAAWQQESGQPVKLSYFGTAHASAYGIAFEPLPMWAPAPEAAPPGRQLYDPQNRAPGIYALSVTSLHGLVLGDQREAFAPFRDEEPLARLGGSIFLYEVPPVGEPVNLVLAGVEPAGLASEIRSVLPGNDLRVRWLDDGAAFVWPAAGGWLVLGDGVALDEALRPFLPEPTVNSNGQRLYQLPQPPLSATIIAQFEDQLALRSVDFSAVSAGQTIALTTQWQVMAETERPLKIFVHALAANGELLGQWDGLSVAPTSWRDGDVLVQRHQLNWVGDELPASLLVGVYDGETLLRLGEPYSLPWP